MRVVDRTGSSPSGDTAIKCECRVERNSSVAYSYLRGLVNNIKIVRRANADLPQGRCQEFFPCSPTAAYVGAILLVN